MGFYSDFNIESSLQLQVVQQLKTAEEGGEVFASEMAPTRAALPERYRKPYMPASRYDRADKQLVVMWAYLQNVLLLSSFLQPLLSRRRTSSMSLNR